LRKSQQTQTSLSFTTTCFPLTTITLDIYALSNSLKMLAL